MTAWGLPESHLLPDAVVAFVDGELSHGARDRAAGHVARCPACAAEVRAQRQAVEALRRATAPSMSAGFLASLRAIPEQTELPGTPDNLAVTADGQLVAIQRPDRVAGVLGGVAPLGTSTPLGQSPTVLGGGRLGGVKRRAAQGAGVVVSGLVLSALALVGTSADSGDGTGETGGQVPQNANLLPAQMAVPAAPGPATSAPPTPSKPVAIPAAMR